MNKRIQELTKQAEDWADNQNFYESDYRDYLMEKFAQLIVRECEQVSLKNSHRDDDMGAIIARQIRQHFGVDN